MLSLLICSISIRGMLKMKTSHAKFVSAGHFTLIHNVALSAAHTRTVNGMMGLHSLRQTQMTHTAQMSKIRTEDRCRYESPDGIDFTSLSKQLAYTRQLLIILCTLNIVMFSVNNYWHVQCLNPYL